MFCTLGKTLLIEAVCLALSLGVCLVYHENPTPFLLSILIIVAAAVPLTLVKIDHHSFSQREGIVSVAVIWIAISLFGALPFYLSGKFEDVWDCIFESVSGFTTTGASILNDIESMPKGILFWRSFTHFLGGMGVLVLLIALFPAVGHRTQNLMSAESPGPTSEKLASTNGNSAKVLYAIYIGMTFLEFLMLLLTGLDWYDSSVIALSTAGTGGFAVKNASIAAYNSVAVEMIVAVFMLMFGVRFTFWFYLVSGKFRQALRMTEVRFYVTLIAIATALIAVTTFSGYAGNLGTALRYAFFESVSIITTTGFGTYDFGLWPMFAQSILIILMLVGACGGSTGGGMKCSRIQIVFKSVGREFRRLLHPRSVKVLTLEGKTVPDSTVSSVTQFMMVYVLLIVFGTLIVSFDGLDFSSNLTAVISSVGNIGPGLGVVGSSGNFSCFSGFGKMVLSFCMLAGRLEIFPLLLLFVPGTWKRI